MEREQEVIGTGYISVEKGVLKMSFSDGENIYTMTPFSLNEAEKVMFQVTVAKKIDMTLKKRLKQTIQALRQAEPVMVFSQHKGFFYAKRGEKSFIAVKLFSKLIIYDLDKYHEAINRGIRKEVQKISDTLDKLKIKLTKIKKP